MSGLRVTVLGSGSNGNSMVVDNGQTAVLVDAGFGSRSLARRLAVAGYEPEAISAIVVTHEHVDHAQGALPSARRWNWPVYASAGTIGSLRRDDEERAASRCDDLGPELDTGTVPVDFRLIGNTSVSIDRLTFTGIGVSHDATEPLGFIVDDARSGARIGIAVDLGHAPAALVDAYAHLDMLVVESNHDVDMLRFGPYPSMLKRRIASRHGHLSNVAAGDFVAACAHRGLRQVVLAHLSETNNRPEHAVAAVRKALGRKGWKNCAVTATSQQVVSSRIPVAPSNARALAAVQLQLMF